MAQNNYAGRPIFVIQWHVTGLCDQSCQHCYMVNEPLVYRRELEKELTLGDCKRIMDSFVEFCEMAQAKPKINFTGGDPLLRQDFFQVLEYASQYGMELSIMGNPFHLTRENIARMKSLGVVSYQVSLDGMEAMHDSLRKPGSFSATTKAIQLLVACKMRAVVMFTLSKKNHKDLPSAMRLVSNLGVGAFAFARLSGSQGINARISPEEAQFSPKEYRNFLLEIQGVMQELKAAGSKTAFTLKDHLWKLLLYEQGKLNLPPANGQIVSGCHIGSRDLAVLADGTVYACRRFCSPIGKMPEQSVLEVFTSEKLDRYRDVSKFELCRECPLLHYCRGCPAVAFGSSGGNFFAPDPQCWRSVQKKGGSHEELSGEVGPHQGSTRPLE